MPSYGLAVDNWSSTVGTAHTAGDGQLVLAALNGLPTLPANRIYRLTAVTNPDTPTEVILGVFQSTGRAGLALTGLTAAAGYTDVNLAAGVVVQVRVCKATIDELQAGIESHVPGGANNELQRNLAGAFAGAGATWDGTTLLVPGNLATAVGNSTTSNVFITQGSNACYVLTRRDSGNWAWLFIDLGGQLVLNNQATGHYSLIIRDSDDSAIFATTMATGSGATGARPAPVDVGAQWYDTTLHKPIWWDGSAWRDASGAVV